MRAALKWVDAWVLRLAILAFLIAFVLPWGLNQVDGGSSTLLLSNISAQAKAIRPAAAWLSVIALIFKAATILWPGGDDDDSDDDRSSRQYKNQVAPRRPAYLDERDEPRYRDPLPPRDDWKRI